MKKLASFTFIIYLIILVWAILFKFNINETIARIETGTVARSLNLLPFAASGGRFEIFLNVFFFLPFGILLGIFSKKFWKSLFIVLVVSLTFETLQYLFGIGVSDITDVITNVTGGVLGFITFKIVRLPRFWSIVILVACGALIFMFATGRLFLW